MNGKGEVTLLAALSIRGGVVGKVENYDCIIKTHKDDEYGRYLEGIANQQ